MTAGYIGEVFSGIQGEGLGVGERQIFVRLVGCNLRCAYCDTAWARERTLRYRVEKTPGERDFEEHANPLEAAHAAALALRLNAPPGLHGSASFTGGEPLLQPDFVREMAQHVRAGDLQVYLETNGTLAEDLTIMLDAVDVIAMDVKLPSAAAFECWQQHEAFLDAARPFVARGALLFVKAVFVESTTDQEIERVCRLLAAVSAQIPLVLQPASQVARGPAPPSPKRALELQAIAKRRLTTVRVIPQLHKVMGQM
jgi:organic radical activating enzyme